MNNSRTISVFRKFLLPPALFMLAAVLAYSKPPEPGGADRIESAATHERDAVPDAIDNIGKSGFRIFDDQETENEIFGWQKSEHSQFGTEASAGFARTTQWGNSVIMQRSGRKRLYDHNLLLAAMYRGELCHVESGNLGEIFRKAVFVDIGSGILNGDGAPTVRDIFEDGRIWVHLDYIVATDINDPDTRYVDIYRIAKRNLPFPVEVIDRKLVHLRQFRAITGNLLAGNSAVIFRSANSGPDLYYEPEMVVAHLQTMLLAYRDRDLLYLYSKFVLYKNKRNSFFQKIGEIDSNIGTNHVWDAWENVDWSKRKLADLFIPNRKYLQFKVVRLN